MQRAPQFLIKNKFTSKRWRDWRLHRRTRQLQAAGGPREVAVELGAPTRLAEGADGGRRRRRRLGLADAAAAHAHVRALEDDGDAFYDEDMPDAPDIKMGRRKNLDELMATTDDSFVGSFGRDEFEEFRSKMTDDFIQESDDAVRAGDHNAAVLSDARVFAGAEEGVEDVKRQIALESGLADPDAAQEPEPEPEAEEDDGGITVDEDGVEWYEDEEGSWWYRDPGEPDWVLYEE